MRGGRRQRAARLESSGEIFGERVIGCEASFFSLFNSSKIVKGGCFSRY